MDSSKQVEVVELDRLTDEDLDFISSWQAQAFSKGDAFSTWMTGLKYSDNVETHILFCRAVLQRAFVCGTIISTTSRLGLRLVFGPNQQNRVFDTTWRSGSDSDWDRFLELTGGAEAFRKRLHGVLAGFGEQMGAVMGEYGKPAYTSVALAVHPDHQGKGIGRAVHEYTVKKAADSGCRLYFATNFYNMPMYKHMGCTPVADPWGCAFDVPEGYPSEAALCQLVYADSMQK